MINYFVKKRKITLLIFSMIVLMGLFYFPKIPRQEMPDIAANSAMITTVYPGASPEKVEYAVTKIIEEKLNEMHGIETITSQSRDSVSIITVEAKKHVDIEKVWEELRTKVGDVKPELPEGTLEPSVNDELSKSFIQTFNVTADTFDQLYGLYPTLNSWKDQLRTIRNVSDVQLIGLPAKEVKIDLDAGKLREYGITWQQMSSAIQADNAKAPMGNFETQDRTYKLELDESYNPDQLNNSVIALSKDGYPVYLRDIGEASAGFKKPDYYVYHNGKPAISFTLVANLGSNIVEIQKDVDKKEASFQKDIPSWATIENVYTKTDYLDDLFHDITQEMLVAIAAVLLVCSLGLSFVTSVIIALAIPISIAVSMLFAQFFNITLNEISIYSVIILIGVLVDDSVVVNDNINRHLSVFRKTPQQAAVEGAQEVFPSIFTAVLAAIFSFGVLYFLSGELGQMGRPLPIIAALAMGTSMLMSISIVPIFRTWYEQRSEKKIEDYEKPAGLLGKPFKKFTDWYAFKILPVVLGKPLLIGLTVLIVSTSAYGLIFASPIQLFPPANRSEMLIDIRGTSGTSLENTKNLVAEVSKWVSDQPGVVLVSAYAGGSAPDMFGDDKPIGIGAELGQLIVRVDNNTKTAAVVDRWYDDLKEKYPEAVVTPRELVMGIPVGKAVDIRIYGQDITTLGNLSQQVKEEVKEVKGIRNIQDSMGSNLFTLRLEVNKPLMDHKLVSNAALSSTLRLATDGILVSNFDDGKDLINIDLYADQSKTDPLQRIENLAVPNALGQQIPLKEIAQMKTSFNLKVINHRNLSRVIDVTGDLKDYTAFDTMPEVKRLLTQITLPEGYYWELGGEISKEMDILMELGTLLGVAVLLIILTVTIKFNSLSAAFLILLTFLLAFSGSFIGLFITRSDIGFMALMGVISLVGIVSRNGIVLIEFIENEYHSGVELKQSVINAVGARMKPVLLTSSTAIVGLIPIAVSSNVLFRPLAIAIIFGLLYSTILTLVVVPIFYTVIEQYKMKRKNKQAMTKSNLSL
ncbi:efflux RND transporter permease subunit [Desulfosporosinus fructosivorans]